MLTLNELVSWDAAPESTLAVVKLKQAKQYLRDYYCIPETAVCYQETDLILGLKYLNDLADELGLPLVMCITIGSNLGGHVGTLPLPALLGSYSLMTRPDCCGWHGKLKQTNVIIISIRSSQKMTVKL